MGNDYSETNSTVAVASHFTHHSADVMEVPFEIRSQHTRHACVIIYVHVVQYYNSNKIEFRNETTIQTPIFSALFEFNLYNELVKSVNTNNRKMPKFATTNTNFKKNDYLRHASSYNVHVHKFSVKSG